MYKRVLAAMDEHLGSEAAARYALAIAREAKAKLHIIHVLGSAERRTAFRRAEEAIKRIEDVARGLGVEVEAIIESGKPEEAVRKFAESAGIDLVFAATRHDERHGGPLRRGGVAAGLSEGLRCSLALVRALHLGRMRPREILVPLRGHMADLEERACFAALMARAFGSKAVLFHAMRPEKRLLEGRIRIDPRQRQVPAPVAKFAEAMTEYGIEAEFQIATGESSDVVIMEAARARTDLIVLGPSGRRGIRSILKPDFVEGVLKGAPCDAIVLTPRHGH